MKPYFDTNHAAWPAAPGRHHGLEHNGTGQVFPGAGRAKKGATKVRGGGWRLAFLACLVAMNIVLYLAPRIVPAAAIRPGAAVFAAGLVIMVAGLTLRGWSKKTLGQYFTATVMVSSDLSC